MRFRQYGFGFALNPLLLLAGYRHNYIFREDEIGVRIKIQLSSRRLAQFGMSYRLSQRDVSNLALKSG